MKKVFIKLLFFITFSAVFVSCTSDPYEADKARTTLAINTVGNSELIRDVKFESFEPAGFLKAEDSDKYLDSLYDRRLASDIDYQENQTLKREKDNLKRNEENLKRELRRGGGKYTMADFYRERVNEGKAKVAKEEKELENLKNEVFANPRMLSFYKALKQTLHDNAVNGDSIVYYYNTIYIIDNVKTTQTFTMAKDEVAVGLLSIEDIKEAAYKEWRKSLGYDE